VTAAFSGVPELSSRAVQLRPLLPSDGEWCYGLMCGPAGTRWRYRGRTPSPEVVMADLWRGVFAQFVVTDRGTLRPVGIVGLYNVATEAGRAHAFAVAEPGASSLVVEGFGLLCSWGFSQFDLQRIFIEAPEFNVATFASLGDTAVVEGRLRNYEFWQGRYWDLFIMSLSAEAFAERFGPVLEARRRDAPTPTGSGADSFVALVAELWPLDSLGAVEALCALEELAGRPLPNDILAGLTEQSATLAAEELLARARPSDVATAAAP